MTTPPTAARLREIRQRHDRAEFPCHQCELLAALDYVAGELRAYLPIICLTPITHCPDIECRRIWEVLDYLTAAPPATAGDGERTG